MNSLLKLYQNHVLGDGHGMVHMSPAVAVATPGAPVTLESPAQQRKRVHSDRAQAHQIAEQIREFRSFDYERPGYHCDHG